MDGVQAIFAGAIILFLIVAIIVVSVYVVEAIFLNKLNKKIFGKGTALAWIPLCNIYLLGKLAYNKTVGWILIGACFLCSEFTTTINGVEKKFTLIPGGSSIVGIAEIALFVIAMIRLSKLNKGELNPDIERAKCDTFSFKPDLTNIQPSQQPVNQTVVPAEPQIVATQPVNATTVPAEPQIIAQQPVEQTKYCPACGNALIPGNPTCPTCGRQE